MNCPSCGHENRPGAKFCEECAAPLKRACASCGSELRPSAKFCDECGAPAGGARSEPHASGASATERKVVTIIFGDLVGSTALHERLDAEAVRQFMEGYYAAMRGAVEAHGGRVTQVMGDGVKAVFGAPRVAEDDAIRAVRAGVEMQRAFRALAEQQAGRVGKTGLRVAVNTGEVVADGETEIIGDPVNVAARLQEQGKDGDVVIGGATQRIVASLVTLEKLGSFALKGRSEQVEAYRVVSLDPPAATKAAFVGRDEELAKLAAVYEAAVSKPAAQLAVLLGSPGLGKSRLIDEFVHHLGDTASVLLAHCDAAGGPTFAPLVAALRERLGLEEAAKPEALRAAIEAMLPTDDPERARIATGVAALLAGSPASPEETFFVVRRLLAALARTRPVVLVIDDLHWAESLLLDLVEHLVQWGSGVPLFVLVGARPELRELRSSLVTPGGFVSDVLTLAGLDAGAAMRLAAGVIGAADLPAVLAAKLLAASEGNPLFVGELVKMLVQEGVLHQDGERWVASAALADLEMPPTIHALLAARIERLRPEERAVLERAAVVGRHFSKSAVAALLSQTGDLDARLESLRRSELIERDTGWFLGEPVLRFHHVLIRDAAYRRILKGTRAELHARLAGWIEGRVGDAAEHDETIGWHLEQAHQHLAELGPLDAAGVALGERAAQRLAAAGRRALARDDVPVAASLLGRALACLPSDAAERADLALDWCEALLSAGDVAAAGGAIAELARTSGDSPRLRAWHTCFAGQLTALTEPQSLNATANAVATAAEELAALEDAAGEAKAHFVHAQALMRLGKVGACEAALDRALAAARRAGDRRRANAVLAGAPLAALWGPSPVTRASGRCLDVVRVLRITQGAPAVEAVALSCQGVLEALRGRTDAARRMLASSRKLVEELGIAHRLFEADAFAGRIAAMEGDAAAAECLLRGAYEGLRDLGLGIDAARAGALLARSLLAQGRAAEAEALSHESEALAGDDLQASIAWRGVRAEALAQRGEYKAAIELAQAAVAIAAATDALLDHADARMALAAALRAAGRPSEADAEERSAIELWEAKGATLLAERARREDARVSSAAAVPAPAARPTQRRRVRPNVATENSALLDAAIAARDPDAFSALLAEGMHIVDHTTETEFGREGALASWRALAGAEEPTCRHEPLATLGDSLGLLHLRISASGTSGGRMDVGAYEKDDIHLVETDARARRCAGETWAVSRLGDAVARLYARHAELLPEGPARVSAAAIARSVAAMLTASTEQGFEASVAPGFEAVDHRLVGHESVPAEALQRGFEATSELEAERRFRVDDVLALGESAFLRRTTHSGVVRASGGAFERTVLALTVFRADGRITRHETFDVGQEPEALARFDELTGDAASRPVRRVRANAATRNAERLHAAIEARDADALLATLSPEHRVIYHPTGTSYGADGIVASWRMLFGAREMRCEHMLLATLGDALVLLRQAISTDGLGSVGSTASDILLAIEVAADGRALWSEVFADDHLGDAIVRLYERHAAWLPEGSARTRAEAMARSLAALLMSPDLDRIASALAPRVETRDHTVLGYPAARGRDVVLRAIQVQLETARGITQRVDEVLSLRSDVLLVRRTVSGTLLVSGGAYEKELISLYVCDGDGLVTQWEQFSPNQQAEAFARFDALLAGAEPPCTVRRRVPENAATRSFERGHTALVARDADALAQLFDEALQVVHHPSGSKYGRREMLTTWRSALRAARFEFRQEILASLGDALALDHHVTTVEGLTETDLAGFGLSEFDEISLLEVDERGRWIRSEIFATDRLGDAIVRLYERYAERLPEGGAHTRAEATARSVEALLGPGDLDAWCAPLAPACELIDHRTLGFPSMRGREAVCEFLRAGFETSEEQRFRIDDLLGLRPDAMLWRGALVGTVRSSGGAFEIQNLTLTVINGDGLFERVEYFDVDREAEALARFDALTGGGEAEPASDPFENAAARSDRRLFACFNARDWAGIEALAAPELVFDERRRLVRNTCGREIWLEQFRLMFDLPKSHFTTRLVATRGERLSLSLHHFEGEVAGGGGPLVMDPHPALHEVDGAGRIVAIVLFDQEDADAAWAELDARYAAGEGAARPRAWRADRATVGALASRDWERLVALCAPDLVEHDHRGLAVLGTTRGAEGWVGNFRTLVELAPDTVFRTDHFRAGARGFCTVGRFRGSREGGVYEMPLVVVVELDEEDRFARCDLYDPEHLAQALVRFAKMEAAAKPPARFGNAAAYAADRMVALFVAGSWQAFIQMLPTSFRFLDRRRMALLDVGREHYVDGMRSLVEGRSARIETELVATRGERLALQRRQMEIAGGDVGPSEMVNLTLIETDERGAPQTVVRFEDDDLIAATAELDARYAAGEAAAHPLAATWLTGYLRAFAARDWDAMAALLAPDLVSHNHRLVGWGTRHGPEGVVSTLRAQVELAPDTRERVDHVRLCARGVLFEYAWCGTREGGAFENLWIVGVELDALGRGRRAEVWEPESQGRALAWFAEVAARSEPGAHRFANAASRAVARMLAVGRASGWQSMASELLPSSFRFHDRRRLALLDLDREGYAEYVRSISESRSMGLESELIATRGERLALERQRISLAGGDVGASELVNLSVYEVDARGECVALVRFDEDDLEAAYAELETRWRAGEAAGHEAASTWLREFGAALAARDWDAAAPCFAPDFVGEDHRLVGWGMRHGPEAFVETFREMTVLAPDARIRGDHVRLSHRALLMAATWVGTRDGGAFESPFIVVMELDARGRAVRNEFYDPHHAERALARFAELTAGAGREPHAAPPVKPNAASGWLGRFQAAFNTRDWDALPALYASDVTYEDRQRFSLLSGGIDMLLSSVHERADAGALLERFHLLGTAGDRVAIQRLLWAGGEAGDRFEMEHLVVQEVDEAGRLVATTNFDLDDARAAQREAWTRWAGIDPVAAGVAAPMGELVDAFDAHDRGRWRAQLAAELVVEDHRRTGFGRLEGADACADSLAALWDLAPETKVEAGWHWPALDRHGAITLVRRTGVLPDGGEFESEYLNFYTVSRGRITHLELFEVEDLDAALARFEALRPDPLRIPPNPADRAAAEIRRLLESRGVGALRSLVSDDFGFEDRSRRSLVSGGVEEWQRALEFLVTESRGSLETRLVATVGDRLALHLVFWRDAGDREHFEIERYRITEIDTEGRLRALVLFDPDDRTAAFQEAEARFLAGEAAGVAGQAPVRAFVRAVCGHDWEALLELLTPDFVFDDHRTLGMGVLDRESWVASVRAQDDLTRDLAVEDVRTLAWNRYGRVTLRRIFGTNLEGGPFENVFANVTLCEGDLIGRVEVFDPDDAERAVARFHELCATRPA